MKKILFLVAIFALMLPLTAQTLPIKSGVKKNAAETALKEKPNFDMQIKSALLKDEELQKMTISHLKSHPDSASALVNLEAKNDGSSLGMIKSILGDTNLKAIAIEFISKNPELLQKVIKLAGM
jgi:hypothetical protein